MAAVNVYVLSDASPFPVIAGVNVGVYDPATYAELGLAVTDSSGRAGFLLDPGTYEVRCQKLGVRFGGPSSIVVSATDPNGFSVNGTVLVTPAPTDPSLCRCYGRLVSLQNSPLSGSMIRVSAISDDGKQNPKVLNGNLVAAESYLKHSDQDGMVAFDLPRGGKFYIAFAGEEDQSYEINIPDRPLANLFDLMFPFPLSLAWNSDDAPGNAVTLPVDGKKTVRWTMTYSDLTETPTGSEWLKFDTTDNVTAALGTLEGIIELVGVAAGSTTVVATTVQPKDKTIRLAVPIVSIPPLSVTVTP